MRATPVRGLVLLSALPLLLGFTAFRDPNTSDAVRWEAAGVEISLQQDGSDDIGDGSDLAAMRAAIATWQSALAGRFNLEEGPTSSSRSYGNDGVNRVTFLESSWPGAADTALGTTLPHVVGGHFVDVDVLLNGSDGPWAVDGDPAGIDLRSVVTHELGHLIGLWHAFHPEAVMYTGARGGTTFRRALTDDDIRGARFVTSGSLSCNGAADCPLLVAHFGGAHLRLTCQAGSCQPGSASYGAECLDGSHCQSGHCLGDPWTGNNRDPGACTQTCTPGSCPGGDLCKDLNGTRYCLPGRSCLDDSDCGGGSNDRCLFDFDGRYRCRRLCMLDGHCTAPARCVDLDYGAGICLEPGSAANGADCLSPHDCMGLACRGSASELKCSTAPSHQDGGSVPDIPSVGDGGGVSDRGRQDAGGGLPEASVPDTADYAGPPDEEGCSCRGGRAGALGWSGVLGLLALARWRRRRRRVTGDRRR